MSGRDRLSYLASAAKGWAKVQPEAAWSAVMGDTNGGTMLTQPLGPVLDELGRQDPVLAAQRLLDVESHWNRDSLLRRVLDKLETNEDRNRLLSSLLASPSAGSERALKALFHNWGRYDTDAPLAAAGRLDDARLAHAATLGILEGWASVDGKGAFDYIVESGDSRLINDALAPVAREWANSATADEMQAVLAAVSSSPKSAAIIKNLVADLARADPQLAMASVMTLKDPSAQANHARDTLSIWADANLDDAEGYFQALPPGQTKNYAIWGLFNPAMGQGASPQRILAHAAALGDVEAEGRALFSMAEYTRVADLGERSDQLATALESYVAQHAELPEDMKEKILQKLSPQED